VNRRLVIRSSAVAVAYLACGLGLAGCGSSGGGSSTDTIAPVQSGTVDISATDNYFVPEDVAVTEGSDVVWTNEGRNQHNVVPVGPTPFGVDVGEFQPGQTFSWKAGAPGEYHYYCSIHGTATAGMIGTIQVVAP
jgi:plastocyanin